MATATRLSADMFGFSTGTVSQQWLKNLALIAVMVGSTAALFIIDVWLEHGALDGYPYLAPLVFASFIRARNVAFPAALLLSLVAIVGFVHSDAPTQMLDNEVVGMLNVAISVAALFGTAFAIEHHRNMRDELAQRLDQLRNGEETRHRIMSVIAHDLRSPLMPIIGFGELLFSHKSRLSDEQVTEYGSGIAQSGHRLLETLDKLLDWARSVDGSHEAERSQVDLRALAHDAIALLEPVAAQKGVRLSVACGPCEAYADPTAIGTIIRNLVSNAIKFSSAGAEINVSVRPEAHETIIEVADHGVGMSPSLVESLNRASQVRSRSGTAGETGTGLGLAICRSLAEQNGGALTVHSREGEGTTITITLPSAPAA